MSTTDEQGLDTTVTVWQGAGLRILVDDGPFSDPLSGYQERPDHRVYEEQIDGRPARIVTFRTEDGGRFTGVNFPRTGGAGPVTVTVEARPEVDAGEPLTIVRSIQF